MRWSWVVVLAGCQGGDTPGTDDGGIDTSEWPEAWATMEEQVVALCNAYRSFGATCFIDGPMPGGLAPLEMDPTLRGTARAHSTDMATRGFFDHRNPDGLDPFDRFEAAGFTGDQPWGENIAAGAGDAEFVVEQWMNSHEGHCENIMEPDFHVIGVGYDFDEDSYFGHYWTQNFAGSH